MRKMLWALLPASLLLFGGNPVFAQKKPSPKKPASDTIIVRNDTSMVDEMREGILDNIPVISLDENDLGDGSSQNVSSALAAGRDPFFAAAAFSFSPARFRIRGYDADMSITFMNGIPIDNLDNGFTPWGLWGGLNDVMRNRDVTIGLRPTTYAFGGPGGVSGIDARASRQRKQTRIGYALSNRNYVHRWHITHNTGMSQKGWAFSFAASRRWATEGYVPGTYFDGWSFFASVDKRLGTKDLISATVFGAPTENGRQNPPIQESMDLNGTNYYNPAWGWQNGKKRNANVGRTNQPFLILNHEHRFNNHTTLMTAVGGSTGERSTSGIDWYNAPDPRPDYYRYLPSFVTDPQQKELVTRLWQTDDRTRQINWDRLYEVNRNGVETIRNVNGIAGNDVTGRRSRYINDQRVINTNRLHVNSVFNTLFGDHLEFTAGAQYQLQNNHYFRRAADLLGGDFWVDLNQFAERDFPLNSLANQNDINRPNRLVRQGDLYGYNYDIHIRKASAFAQANFKYEKFDVFLAVEGSNTRFWRDGNVKNGLYPDNSFGKSKVQNFTNYMVKGGFTYKIDGRNYLFANGSAGTRAPFFDNVYVSPRTRDFTQENVANETIQTVEGGYLLNAPKIKFRLTGYYTRIGDQMNVMTFFHEQYINFVNYALSNIDREHFGAEMGFEAKLYQGLSLTGAAAVGRYYFTSRQNAVITIDNLGQNVAGRETIYSNNFRVGNTPQEAYSLGLQYRSPKFWFVGLTANYFGQMWVEMNPVRRTYTAVEGVDPKSDLYASIINQTQLDDQQTLDFFGGYSWKLPKNWNLKKPTYLMFNLGINNLLNNQRLVTTAFEQLRFDTDDKNVNQFPPRFFYAYGVNFFASVTLRF